MLQTQSFKQNFDQVIKALEIAEIKPTSLAKKLGSNPPPTSNTMRLLDYQGVFFVFMADPMAFIADLAENKKSKILLFFQSVGNFR